MSDRRWLLSDQLGSTVAITNASGAATAINSYDEYGAPSSGNAGLAADQRIETADDRVLLILDIARTDRVERTYNLTVSGPHTFLVGENGAVVHNLGWCRGTTVSGIPFSIILASMGRVLAPNRRPNTPTWQEKRPEI